MAQSIEGDLADFLTTVVSDYLRDEGIPLDERILFFRTMEGKCKERLSKFHLVGEKGTDH